MPKKSLVQVYFPKRGMNLSYYNDRFDLQVGDTVYVSGSDDRGFRLDDLSGMKITGAIAERGRDYYTENRVVYLCMDCGHGRGIVEGTSPY